MVSIRKHQQARLLKIGLWAGMKLSILCTLSGLFASPVVAGEAPACRTDTAAAFFGSATNSLLQPFSLKSLVEAVKPTSVHIEAVVVKEPQKQAENARAGKKKNQPVEDETGAVGGGIIFAHDETSSFIATNYHTLKNRDRFRVTLADGRKFEAVEIGHDEWFDLAVLQIEVTGLPEVTFGSSQELSQGDMVIAIGSPRQLAFSVSHGMISAKGRFKQHVPMLQTDAPINPGNSGGGLWNMCGQLVGVVTLFVSESDGINYAIPSEVAQPVLEALLEDGQVEHPYAGFADFDRAPKEFMGAYTVVVDEVTPSGPAAMGHLRKGDIIKKLDGIPVESSDDVLRIIAGHKPHDKVVFEVKRDGKLLQLYVTLGKAP